MPRPLGLCFREGVCLAFALGLLLCVFFVMPCEAALKHRKPCVVSVAGDGGDCPFVSVGFAWAKICGLVEAKTGEFAFCDLAESLPLLRGVDPCDANAGGRGVCSDFNGVAVENADNAPGVGQREAGEGEDCENGQPKKCQFNSARIAASYTFASGRLLGDVKARAI